MRKEEFERKDGTKGEKYWLEVGDKVTLKFPNVMTKKLGMYDSHSVAIEGDIPYLQLTTGQQKFLSMQGDLTGKTIEGIALDNKFKKGETYVGIKML